MYGTVTYTFEGIDVPFRCEDEAEYTIALDLLNHYGLHPRGRLAPQRSDGTKGGTIGGGQRVRFLHPEQEVAMSEKQPRGRGRPPKTGAKLGRLYVNVPTEIIAALTAEAEARGVSLSELTRTALAEWMRNNPPTGVQTPVTVEQSTYRSDETNRGGQ